MPVPLDWSDLGGEQINLAVIKKSASKPDLPIGAMFVGPGGPGVAAIGMVRGGDDRQVGRRGAGKSRGFVAIDSPQLPVTVQLSSFGGGAVAA